MTGFAQLFLVVIALVVYIGEAVLELLSPLAPVAIVALAVWVILIIRRLLVRLTTFPHRPRNR